MRPGLKCCWKTSLANPVLKSQFGAQPGLYFIKKELHGMHLADGAASRFFFFSAESGAFQHSQPLFLMKYKPAARMNKSAGFN
jgi:hypothetical protein